MQQDEYEKIIEQLLIEFIKDFNEFVDGIFRDTCNKLHKFSDGEKVTAFMGMLLELFSRNMTSALCCFSEEDVRIFLKDFTEEIIRDMPIAKSFAEKNTMTEGEK